MRLDARQEASSERAKTNADGSNDLQQTAAQSGRLDADEGRKQHAQAYKMLAIKYR